MLTYLDNTLLVHSLLCLLLIFEMVCLHLYNLNVASTEGPCSIWEERKYFYRQLDLGTYTSIAAWSSINLSFVCTQAKWHQVQLQFEMSHHLNYSIDFGEMKTTPTEYMEKCCHQPIFTIVKYLKMCWCWWFIQERSQLDESYMNSQFTLKLQGDITVVRCEL